MVFTLKEPYSSLLQDDADPTASSTATSMSSEKEDLAHVLLNINNGHLFYASAYKGSPTTDFMELYASTLEVFHSPRIDESAHFYDMDDAMNSRNLVQTIYPSEPTVQSKCRAAAGVGTENVAMLSLAMKSIFDANTARKVR